MMTAWFKHARQTRTPVHGMSSEKRRRSQGVAAAYQTLGAIQITTQLMLWSTLFCYEQTVQTTWQAVFMQLVPIALLWAIWRSGQAALQTRSGAFAALLLLPCLLLDTALLLHVLTGLMTKLVPHYSRVAHVCVAAALCFFTAALGRENGVAYGAGSVRVWLLCLFVLGTVLLNADANPERLWPLWGQGIGKTSVTALSGMGSVWGVALLFLLPLGKAAMADSALRKKRFGMQSSTVLWSLLPWALGLVWALCLGMTHPWRPGDGLSIGQQLVAMARKSSSILLCELSNVMWLLLLIISLAGCVMSGEKLLRNAVLKIPRSIAAAALLLPGVLCTVFWPEWLFAALTAALPYRMAFSAVAGVAMVLIAKRGRKQ